jgi:REP element-mobilizing transposase RayT
MPQSHACLHCHIVFSTKNRKPFIDNALQPRLYAYIGGVLKSLGCVLVEAGGMPDHVHLLVSLGRENAVADVVRAAKSNPSKWIHETFPEQRSLAWQAGYGAFAVSYSQVADVRRYIGDRAVHHARMTFQEELRKFLRRHEIAFDERYVWD